MKTNTLHIPWTSIRPWIFIRKGVVLLMGVSVVLVGIIMLVTPGPGLIVIPAGFGILALEFAWAKTLLNKGAAYFKKYKEKWDARNHVRPKGQ